ncbi:MAG: GxxExxY protein [Anaerolineales bacterium]
MAEILFRELSFVIIGAAMEVHRILGPGFLESTYHAALIHELSLRNIPFQQHVKLPITYKGEIIGNYEADIVIDGKIILELKAVDHIHEKHLAQAHHYLTATGLDLAIVINFGEDSLKSKRVIRKTAQIKSS